MTKFKGFAYPNNMGDNGMTLRDYFAAKAMQGIMSNSSRRIQEIDAIVSDSYDVADAMLKRREI